MTILWFVLAVVCQALSGLPLLFYRGSTGAQKLAAGLMALGSLAGVAAGVVAGRLVEALLYEVEPTGLDTMAAPILTLALVALVASLPPALRAARVDPAQTLRSE